MKDFEITVTVRNNRLKARRLELGLTQKQIARRAGVCSATWSGLEVMRLLPWKKVSDGRLEGWSDNALKISTFFKVEPEEIWPEYIRLIKESRVVKELDVNEAAMLMGQQTQRLLGSTPDDEYANAQMASNIKKCLKEELKPREADVIRRRFGFDGGSGETFESIAKDYGISSGRVGQIEGAALRKLRHPTRVRVIRGGGCKHENPYAQCQECVDEMRDDRARRERLTEQRREAWRRECEAYQRWLDEG